jgi:hypothetical protein
MGIERIILCQAFSKGLSTGFIYIVRNLAHDYISFKKTLFMQQRLFKMVKSSKFMKKSVEDFIYLFRNFKAIQELNKI